MQSISECCGLRPTSYEHMEVGEIPDLKSLLVKQESDASVEYESWSCQNCGQVWHQYWINRGHMDDPVVTKAGIRPGSLNLAGQAVPAAIPPGASRLPKGDTSGAICIVTSVAGLIAGLARLPAELTGRGDRYGFVLAHMIAGLVFGIVAALIYDWIHTNREQ